MGSRTTLSETSKEDFQLLLWVFVCLSLPLGGRLVSTDGKFSFKLYMYIYTKRYVYYRCFLENN